MGRASRLALSTALAVLGPAAAAPGQVQFGVELARDRATWHFDNPSAYDTSELVPHFFEQRYTLDNLWVSAEASYRAGVDWHTSLGFTPRRQAAATDYDTFFNPGNVTWVSGTTGDAVLNSLRLAQAVDLGRVGGLHLTGGYRLRVDRADFLDGYRTDTRNGVLVAGTIVTTREYTTGQTHEVFVSGTHTRPLSAAWQLRVAGELTPAAVNRLAIQLPDKYPGRTLVYWTTNVMTSGRLELRRGTGRWPVTVGLSGRRSWNYRATQSVTRNSLSVAIGTGRTW